MLIQYGQRIALCKRPDKGLLAGMYEFPSMEGNQNEEQVISYLKSLSVMPLRIRKLKPAKHIFSHKEWHMTGYFVKVDELTGMGEYVFVDPAEIKDKYPVPSAYAAYMDLI